MSSLRASGMMHRGPRFEFARLGPGSAVGKKATKRGQIGKILASEESPAVAWATSRLASPADFFPFSPKRSLVRGYNSVEVTRPSHLP